jgi:hypothetical protein
VTKAGRSCGSVRRFRRYRLRGRTCVPGTVLLSRGRMRGANYDRTGGDGATSESAGCERSRRLLWTRAGASEQVEEAKEDKSHYRHRRDDKKDNALGFVSAAVHPASF